MSRNWIRQCSLIVSGSAGQKNLGNLRVVFSIKQSHVQSPNMASFRVYNCSPDTRSKLKGKEFTKVQFEAGYQDNTGLIYSGNIVQAASGHETAVDSYVDIHCAEGDPAYNQARVSKTLAAGWTPKDKLQAALDAMKPFGITPGINTLDLSVPKAPRGLPMAGMARDIIREVVMSKGGLWSIQGDKLHITPKELTTNDSGVVVLTAATGLVGWPRQTLNGIQVRSLLNPALRPLVKVKLDPSGIIEAERDNNPTSGTAVATNTGLDQQELGAGTYTIFWIDRNGDTRGNEWFDEFYCVGGSVLPQSAVDAGLTIGGGEAVQTAGQANLGQGGIGHA